MGGAAVTGSIGVPGDVDMFALPVVAGREYTVTLKSAPSSGLADPYLVLLSPTGVALAQDDDSAGALDSRLTFAADSTGNYFVSASDFDVGIGTYAVSVIQRNVISGSPGPDSLQGGSGPDSLHGGAGRDSLRGGRGDDWLDGGADIDTVVYAGLSGAFSLAHGANGWSAFDAVGLDGLDQLTDVERITFADLHLALDLDGHAGLTAKILGAVFGAASVANREYVAIGLDLLDSGMGYETLMQLAINARLGAGASHKAVVDLLYTNVVGYAPPKGDEDYFVALLDSHAFTAASLGVLAAETDQNQLNIDLIGLADTGLPFG